MSSMMTREAVAERLKEARLNAGFRSAADAARRLGLKDATVRAHESGQNGVSPAAAARYARAYHITTNFILFGHDEAAGAHQLLGKILEGGTETGEFGPLVYVRGRAETGVWKEKWSDGRTAAEWLQVSVENHEGDQTLFAVEIADLSMGEYYRPGQYVVVSSNLETGLQLSDHVAIVQFRAGLQELTIRELRTDDHGVIWYHARPRPDHPAIGSICAGNTRVAMVGAVVAMYERRVRDKPQVSLSATLEMAKNSEDEGLVAAVKVSDLNDSLSLRAARQEKISAELDRMFGPFIRDEP